MGNIRRRSGGGRRSKRPAPDRRDRGCHCGAGRPAASRRPDRLRSRYATGNRGGSCRGHAGIGRPPCGPCARGPRPPRCDGGRRRPAGSRRIARVGRPRDLHRGDPHRGPLGSCDARARARHPHGGAGHRVPGPRLRDRGRACTDRRVSRGALPMTRVVRMEPPRAILSAKGLAKRYAGRRVVDDVSIEVSPGEILGLLGHNGAGKTTTFYMIVGLVRADAGEVWIGSRRVTDEPVDVRVRAGLGYLAQEPSVFRRLTVEENILMVLEQQGVPDEVRRQRTDRLLDEFGLLTVRRQPAWTLSGGERRRVEIARALSLEPTFLLLDEPFTGIDPRSVQELQRTVRYLRERGLGLVITDHNVRDTLAITDRVEIIHEGRILLSGKPGELLKSAEARRLYLGEGFRL